MKLIPAVCPQCGAKLKLPEKTTKTNCQFCGVEIMLGNGEVVHVHKSDVKGEWERTLALVEKHAEQDNLKEITPYGKKLIELNPDSPLSWFYYGASYAGRPQEAIAAYGKALAEGWKLYDANPEAEDCKKFKILVEKKFSEAQWSHITSFIWMVLGFIVCAAIGAVIFASTINEEPECAGLTALFGGLMILTFFLAAIADFWFIVAKNPRNFVPRKK